jgi:hypothetical protein
MPVDMLVPLLKARPGRKREPVRAFAHIPILAKCERQFLGRLKKGPLPKQRLQQTLSREFAAPMFHHIVNRLLAEGYLFLHDGTLHLTRRGALAMGYKNVSMSDFAEFEGNRDGCPGRPVRYRKYWMIFDPGPTVRNPIESERDSGVKPNTIPG